MELKTYRVINEELVRQLALQLGLTVEVETTTESEFKGGIASFGSARRRSQKISSRKLDNPRLLKEIVEGLREHRQLKIYRPERMRDLPGGLPLSTRSAWKEPLSIFLLKSPEIGFIDSEPDGSWAWDWVGSYLFLVEEHQSEPESTRCWSGISALRLLVEDIAGHNPGFHKSPDGIGWGDRYGRDDPTHPIEKLRRAGGMPLRRRRVEIVYRVAAMTNEQATTINGKEVRLNDILAYPLYIADS